MQEFAIQQRISKYKQNKLSVLNDNIQHCPAGLCPAGLDIGLINKYYDLAQAGDGLAIEHYRTLEKNASDCISCGHCDRRCPFSVRQSGRMQEIRAFMEGLR